MACNLNYMRRRMQLGAQPHKAKASGAVATFRTNLAARLDSLFVDVTPVQDLHGQQYPYPAGGSKNLFGAKLSDCKTINTSGTWTGDSYAVNGVTYSIDTTNDGYITSIRTSGTATATTALVLGGVELTEGVTYIVNGCPSGGSNNKYELMLMQRPSPGTGGVSGGHDYGEGLDYTETTTTTRGLQAVIRNGQNSNGLVFYPMVRLATVSDATFAPYSNVCPITGWAAAKVTGTGNNLVKVTAQTTEMNGITFTIGTDGVVDIDGTASANAYISLDATGMLFKKDVQYIISGCTGGSSTTYQLDVRAIPPLGSFYDGANGISRNGESTFTGKGTKGYITVLVRNGTHVDHVKIYPMVRPATVSDNVYTPYVGTTAVIQFGQTLYGAQIDWNGRKAVCYGELVTLDGTEGWMLNSVTTGYYRIIGDRFDVTTTPMFNYLKALAPGGGAGLNVWQGRLNKLQSNQYHVLLVKPLMSVYDTVDKWKEYLSSNPLQALIDLEQPVEIPLDLVDFVTVPGINNVFADCGNVDLSYWTN